METPSTRTARYQTRNLTPDALHRASFGFKQIDHALAKLIDIELLDQLSGRSTNTDTQESPTVMAPSSSEQNHIDAARRYIAITKSTPRMKRNGPVARYAVC